MRAEDPIETFLRSVEEETALDWDAAVRESGGSEPRVAHLRDVQRIAEFSRRLVRDSVARAGADAPDGPGKWGDLMLLERIGTGAVADVYRAWDNKLSREIALKLLRGGALAGGEETSPLLAEGRALARIRHPHVVAVHGIEVHDGRVGLAMELVRGSTLTHEVMTRGALATGEAIRLGLEIGSAVEAVHAAGLLHRDLKPANVIRGATGRYVLADFGLGVRWDVATWEAARPSGTPMYMAPELLDGAAPSVRTDLYSLGLVMWFALAGRHPYEVTEIADLRAAQRRGPARIAEARPDVPRALAALVDRAVSPDPNVRFATATEWLRGLGALQTKSATIGRPRVLRSAAAVGVVTLAAVVAATVVQRNDGDGARPAVVERQAAALAGTAADAAAPAPVDAYTIEASFVRRGAETAARLVDGDRVRLGDRLSLELRTSRETWVYVLNEDERGECYLLFPQPLFDQGNPLPADAAVVLPGTIEGSENAWTVTSQGGREHFLVVASPEPVAELEAQLRALPAPEPGRQVRYAAVGAAAMERLRGAGGLAMLAPDAAKIRPKSATFAHYRALAGREDEVRGLWVRHIAFDNPAE